MGSFWWDFLTSKEPQPSTSIPTKRPTDGMMGCPWKLVAAAAGNPRDDQQNSSGMLKYSNSGHLEELFIQFILILTWTYRDL